MSCCKSILHDDVAVGDVIVHGLEHVTVTAIRRHPPGTHSARSPIHNHLTAIEYVTPRGSRWKGVIE